MSSYRKPVISQRDGVTVISLGSEYKNLDERGLDDVKSVILDVSTTADPPIVVIDLSHTGFFGSAFIEILFRAWNRLNSKDNGKFCISGLTSHCREVIDVTHLDSLWMIFETIDDAVEALAQK